MSYIKNYLLEKYFKYLWKNSIDLKNEWAVNENVTRLGIVENGYSTGEIKKNSDLFPNHIKFKQIKNTGGPGYKFEDKYIYKVNGAMIIGPYGLGIDKKGRIIKEMTTFFSFGRFKLLVSSSLNNNSIRLLKFLMPFQKIYFSRADIHLENVCVLLHCWNNYYHWITEQLPKLQAVHLFEKEMNQKVTIIIPPNPPKFITDSLKHFNVHKENLLEWHSEVAEVDNLIVPTYPEITNKSAAWLRKKVLNSMNIYPSEKKERIYISRIDAKERRVINEEEVLKLIKRYGFKFYELSNMSFDDQVQLFSKAEIVIAPHGAGLTNILWSNNIKVIEIFAGELSFHYARIADACDHDYDCLLTKKVGKKSDLFVNISDLETSFERMNIEKVKSKLNNK